uniref:Metalloendopeptidase n=1 Tax=Parastrongyloides trichosuri TaxID=131310 RepID=A0A0N4Z2X7_PARTI
MCESALGKKSKNSPQEISIGQDCNHITDVVHEISHALGVIHEMNRPDRDKYITIIDKNVNPSISSSFESRFSNETLTYNLKYDYGSAMHYDRIAGSTSGKDIVTVPKDIHYLKTIGQRSEIGFNDIKQLNLHYCKEKCNNTLPCKVKGYPNPHKCTECKCPRFYTGRYCDRLLPSDSTCGKRKLIANIQPETFTMEGKKSCYIQILAPVGFKVRLEITEALFEESFVCEPGTGLEVKYYKDKSVSGAVFCGNVTNNVIFSEGQSV